MAKRATLHNGPLVLLHPRPCWRVLTVGPTFYALWLFVLFLERAHLSVLVYWGGGFRVFGFPQFHIFLSFFYFTKFSNYFFTWDKYKKGERCQICKQIAGADGSACDPSKMNFNLVLFFCFLLHKFVNKFCGYFWILWYSKFMLCWTEIFRFQVEE